MASSFRLSLAVLGLATAMAACTTPPGIEVSQRATPTKIDHVSRVVPVAVQSPLRVSDAVALRQAVSSFGPAEAVHASVAVPPRTSAAARASLRKNLVESGVPPTNITFVATAAASGEVVLHRYVVTPPACRQFSLDLNRSSQENPSTQGGCTNERNLTLMVEDPRDLVRGRTIGPADATQSANGIDRYRTDKVKELLKPERLTTQ